MFAAPEEDERARLWERQTTTGTRRSPTTSITTSSSRLFPKMSGANIRNAAHLRRLSRRRRRRTQITQAHLIRAARAEYRSMGHVIADMQRSL